MDAKATNAHQDKYVLRNYWEDRVIERTRDIVSKLDMCQCEKCFLDICALVLNKLPPQYVTTDRGNLMMKVPSLNTTAELELTVLVSRCAKMVSEKPMHTLD